VVVALALAVGLYFALGLGFGGICPVVILLLINNVFGYV
jgi:hypothetical protein